MKKILFSFSLLLICFGCINVSAIEECTTSELNRLKELANNVSFQYEYEIEKEKYYAVLTLSMSMSSVLAIVPVYAEVANKI